MRKRCLKTFLIRFVGKKSQKDSLFKKAVEEEQDPSNQIDYEIDLKF